MRRRRTLFNSVSTTIDGIEEVLYDGIVLSYQNNNQEILFETISTLDDIIYKSIGTATSIVFYRNLPLIKNLYKISLSSGKYSSNLKNKSYESIRTKITHILFRIEQKVDARDNEVLVKEFLRYSLTQYNGLLHDILLNKDLELYKEATNEYYSYIFKKYLYSERNKAKEALDYEIEYYVNSVAIFQYSWIIYLYREGKITTKECIDYLNTNRLSARNYERILDTLIYIDTMSHFDAFGVDEWENDVVKINHTLARSPLKPQTWTNLGMMIFLIKNSGLVTREINPNRIRSTQRFFELYFNEFQVTLSEIRANKDIWIPIIFNNTLSDITKNSTEEDDFIKRIDYISDSLKRAASQLMKIEFVDNNNRLASEPFSEAKAIEYRESVGSKWYKRSFLHRLFENYGNWKNSEDSDSITPVGYFIFQQGMKMMFVEEGYNLVHGSGDLGSSIADYEDGDFLNNIKKDDTPVRSFNSIVKCLDKLIKVIKANKFTPTVIIIGAHWAHSTNDLAFHKDFIPDWKLKEESEEYSSNFSLYKDIPLYTSYNKDFEEYIVVADFQNAFLLNQVRNDKWYKEQLQVDTIPVDDNEARRIFNENPKGWKISPKGHELSEEEALNYIKTGIVWDIHVRETFEISNPLAYAVGRIPLPKKG
ncbi:hypothetical protein [Sporocytophaga myxococcoides]|uniref:hypothetical protein n=1 Tax=Sporocytophaga myxococcoides TaxID=153721 RepID=UPI000400E179|nr:hypothetical protein [Sporocytophaga myxococcoides]